MAGQIGVEVLENGRSNFGTIQDMMKIRMPVAKVMTTIG